MPDKVDEGYSEEWKRGRAKRIPQLRASEQITRGLECLLHSYRKAIFKQLDIADDSIISSPIVTRRWAMELHTWLKPFLKKEKRVVPIELLYETSQIPKDTIKDFLHEPYLSQ